MPKFQISWKAEVNNVKSIIPMSEQEYTWIFKVKCTKCHESNDKEIYFRQSDVHEHINSRGSSNIVMKCKFCDKIGQLDIIPATLKALDSETLGFQPLVMVEARGFAPIDWIPGTEFRVTTQSGTVFENVDLQEREWCEYDEASGQGVEIMDIQVEIK